MEATPFLADLTGANLEEIRCRLRHEEPASAWLLPPPPLEVLGDGARRRGVSGVPVCARARCPWRRPAWTRLPACRTLPGVMGCPEAAGGPGRRVAGRCRLAVDLPSGRPVVFIVRTGAHLPAGCLDPCPSMPKSCRWAAPAGGPWARWWSTRRRLDPGPRAAWARLVLRAP